MTSKDSRSRTELVTSSSTVDIVSIPWHFLAMKYDQIEQLFIPLLSAAQHANDVLGVRTGGAESALHAAAHLSGELLRDASFSPVRSLSVNAANAYLIDFGENSFQVETSVSIRDERKASLFRVKVMGAIRGDKFMVMDPVSKNTLFSFTRFEANKPDFFTSEFPFIADESRQNPAMFAGENSAMVHGVVDLVLGIPVGEEAVTVRVHKQSNTHSLEVKNPITNEILLSLPIASLGNISKLVETIAQHLNTNADARRSLAPGSAAPGTSAGGKSCEAVETKPSETLAPTSST